VHLDEDLNTPGFVHCVAKQYITTIIANYNNLNFFAYSLEGINLSNNKCDVENNKEDEEGRVDASKHL
jgi:hypothetical protein